MHWLWNLIPLVLVGGAIWLVLKYLRPRLRANRYAAWEREGLLPDQVDPHAVDRSRDARPTD
ncbi:hypothetical protein [Calidifontibacter terrae]